MCSPRLFHALGRARSAPARGALVLLTVLAAACGEATRPGAADPPAAVTTTTPHHASARAVDTTSGADAVVAPSVAAPVAAAVPATPASEPAAPAVQPEPLSPPPPLVLKPLPMLPDAPAPARARQTPPPAIAAKGAVLLDATSGAILYDKDARTPLPPASTTKIMTALLALERGNLDEVVPVALDERRYWGSVMGLVDGDRFTLRDLLHGLMLPSGNDAAYVIAAHLAGSEAAFADLMNQRLAELALTDSVFRNASGLGRETANYVSPHDMAQIARFAFTRPDFATLVATRCYTARGSRTLGMCNGNELLYRYPGADGVKIGWGGRFGGMTVVGSAVRDGHRLIVALFDTPDRPGESAALLNWGFSAFSWGNQ